MAEASKQNTIVSVVKAYSRRLFGFIRGRVSTDEDAEDILQDVWYQLSNTVEIEEIDSISGWLHRVARNKIIDRYRKKSPEPIDDLGLMNEEGDEILREILLADDLSPEMENLREIFWEELYEALEELPEKQRQVFIWNELEDLTLREIAEKTNENLKTIISRKGYAVKHLRKRLQQLYDEFTSY